MLHQHLLYVYSRRGTYAVQTAAPAARCPTTTTQVPTPQQPRRTTWLVTQTLYSPAGLVPCDFFLFSQVKRQLKGNQFQDVEGARAFFEGVISDFPQSTWSGTMCTWFERMSKRMHAGLGVEVGVLRKTGLGD